MLENRDDFLWGVATSAYQSEGGYNGDGQPRTNWAAGEEKGDFAVTGVSSDFWNRYEEDFARCRDLGLNAFRMGIEWSRVQPGAANIAGVPPFDYAALDHYAKLLTRCQEYGLEPVVTLHHFVHPEWLGTDPWLDPGTADVFAKYVREAVGYICARMPRPIRWFITINEPNMLVLNSYLGHQFPAKGRSGLHSMTLGYNGLLCAHVAAYNALHDLYTEHGWPEPKVALNNYCSDLYWSDKLLLDLLCARERGVATSDIGRYIVRCVKSFEKAFSEVRIPLHKDLSYYFGAAIKRLSNWYGYRHFDPQDFAPFLRALYSSPRERVLDYIGLDYYDPFAAHAFRLPVFWDHEFKSRSFRSWMLATVTSKWWDWRVLPRGLHFFCRHYAEDFGRSVLIAENGMALRRKADNSVSKRRDGMTRSQFLRLHVHEVTKILKEGIPLVGYLHWSLFDNYEWGSYTPRFGLYSIDYQSGTERSATDPWGDTPAATYAMLVEESRRKLHASAAPPG